MTLTAGKDDDGRRLDRILRRALPELPLSALHRLLRKKLVLAEGRPLRGEERISAGTVITILPGNKGLGLPMKSPAASSGKQRGMDGGPPVSPEEAGLLILWEGRDLLILNKPAGLAVHGGSLPGKRKTGDSLEKRVRAYLSGRLPPSLSFTPGPLHRLDKNTSGIIVFSRSLEGARTFSAFLREGKIRKKYLAVLEGGITKNETWKDDLFRDKAEGKTLAFPSKQRDEISPPAGTRSALTRIIPLKQGRRQGRLYTLARIEIETGRTHQIRSQAASHGHPLAGDKKYGGAPFPGGFFLHAAELELPPETPEPLEPARQTGKGPATDSPRIIRADLPEAFAGAVREIFDKQE